MRHARFSPKRAITGVHGIHRGPAWRPCGWPKLDESGGWTCPVGNKSPGMRISQDLSTARGQAMGQVRNSL